MTEEHILPIFHVLMRDESSEVRLNLFKRLEDLQAVLDIDEVHKQIVPSLQELS